MSIFSYHIIIVVVALLYCVHFSMGGSNETDKISLLHFKSQITNNRFSVLNSWNHSLPFCQWFGVTCGRRHQRVMALQLQSSKLTGIISPFIGNLSFLRQLNLSDNNFGGIIPPEIGRLTRLQILSLSANSLEGHIQSNISACTNLIILDTFDNKLVGRIPSEFNSLLNLKYIALGANNLTGTIPACFGNFSSLYYLYLTYNNLDGSIPESLSKLKSIKDLALSENRLSGIMPTTIFNLTSLELIDLGMNLLEGNLPSDIGNTLPYLKWFSISTNYFTGKIPTSISNSSNLESLQLTSNNLRGQVPSLQKLENLKTFSLLQNSLGYGLVSDLNFISSLTNATNLQVFVISLNNFKGSFPSIICNFSFLTILAFSDNYISGHIPKCIENLVNLQTIDARINQLSGVIPQGIGKLQNLIYLALDSNLLSSYIPSSIGNLTKLTNLYLSQNKLKGQIPSTLGNCTYILTLDLYKNHLSGKIPTQVFGLSNLPIIRIDFSKNHLTGSLPEDVGQLKNLVGLDVSENMLSGEIPSTLSACADLESLSMMGNYFQGTIPNALKALKSLKVLDLSRNNLSGTIPNFLASLPLQRLNLSYNINLEGEVPKNGIFCNVSALSIVGNPRLCGGIPNLKLPECELKKQPKGKLGHKKRLIVSVLFGVVGVILLVTLFMSLYCLLYTKRMKKPTSLDDQLKKYPNLSYQTLLKATKDFASESLIGRGTFGLVYKGILDDQDASTVAIKVFNLEQHGAFKSFMVECEALRNIRHRNLVKVVSVCSSIDYQGGDFKALVYEYMVNGSLQDWLHPEKIDVVENTNETPRSLNLQQRIDVATDIACALEYLHYHCGTSILHCDLKPSNVLLDEEMVARVSDFGLAKFLSTRSSRTNTTSSSLGLRGTIGYTPPGKKPTDDMFNGGITLHQYVQEAVPERVNEILDNDLLHDLDEEEMDRKSVLEGLTNILEIAITCSSELPQERLDMRDVSRNLFSIRSRVCRTNMPRRRRI
ncbi:unnamed protein product [Amaranthus hypochondriacus]